jgi:hypothetical protein
MMPWLRPAVKREAAPIGAKCSSILGMLGKVFYFEAILLLLDLPGLRFNSILFP